MDTFLSGLLLAHKAQDRFKEVVLDLNLMAKLCLAGLYDVSFLCFRFVVD